MPRSHKNTPEVTRDAAAVRFWQLQLPNQCRQCRWKVVPEQQATIAQTGRDGKANEFRTNDDFHALFSSVSKRLYICVCVRACVCVYAYRSAIMNRVYVLIVNMRNITRVKTPNETYKK